MGYNIGTEAVTYEDQLTGLKNKNALILDYGDTSLENKHFIYVDIDDFKKMNAIFGMDAVDRMLISVAKTLEEYCGQSTVYRVSAGQFVLVTESHFICEPEELQRILRQPVVLDDLQLVINASICVLDHDDFPKSTLSELIKLMQLTLNIEKRTKKNVLVYTSEENRKQYIEKRDVALSLYSAVKNKEFYPKFIPFVDTFTNEIIGYETVSRWDLNGQMLRPGCYLEAAEWTGLVYDIELQMFEEGVKFLSELRRNEEILANKSINLHKRFKVGIHFSAYTLKRVNIDDLVSILRKYNVNQNDIIIQTKEQFIVDEVAYEKIREFHKERFMVGLDDYSNRAASLSFLADLKIDIIKLSEVLLEHIDNNQEFTKMMNVYKFMTEIAKKFNITVVSDGINSAENAKLVRDNNVHIGLGSFYTRAVVKEELLEYMKNNKKKRFR